MAVSGLNLRLFLTRPFPSSLPWSPRRWSPCASVTRALGTLGPARLGHASVPGVVGPRRFPRVAWSPRSRRASAPLGSPRAVGPLRRWPHDAGPRSRSPRRRAGPTAVSRRSRPRARWSARPGLNRRVRLVALVGLRRREQIDDGPPRIGRRVLAEQAGHTGDRRAGLRLRGQGHRVARPLRLRLRPEAPILRQSRRGPLLQAHHPGTPRERLSTLGPRPIVNPRRGPIPPAHHPGTPRQRLSTVVRPMRASAARTDPTGPPSWNFATAAVIFGSGDQYVKRGEDRIRPAHHPGTPRERLSTHLASPTNRQARRGPIPRAHHPGTPRERLTSLGPRPFVKRGEDRSHRPTILETPRAAAQRSSYQCRQARRGPPLQAHHPGKPQERLTTLGRLHQFFVNPGEDRIPQAHHPGTPRERPR